MRVKRSEEQIGAITLKQSILDGLEAETSGENVAGAIWRFVKASDFSQQMAAIREVGKMLKNQTGDKASEAVIEVLAHAYYQCPPKHPLKRALASCIQGVNSTLEEQAHVILRKHALLLLADEQFSSLDTCRTIIDNLNALMENFPTGEQCVRDIWQEALTFLCTCLQKFYENTRGSPTPVSRMEGMHNCHTTIQVWNKLLTRAASRISVALSTSEKDTGVAAIVGSLDIMWKILYDEGFLMDCRAACGMTLPLILKATAGDRIVQQVVVELFPQHAALDVGFEVRQILGGYDTGSVSVMSRLCVCSGTLAMLDVDDLVQEYQDDKTLLTDIIGPELVTLLDRVAETNGRLLASRTLILWVTKAIQALEQSSGSRLTLLRCRLHGNETIPHQVLDYSWNHWEDAVDVIRHQARIIFEKLLTCHLLATMEEPSESPFILGLTESLLATRWQQRGRYGPLCCLVGHLGAGPVLRQTPTLPQDLLVAITDQALAGYVSELLEKLFTQHRRELGLDVKTGDQVEKARSGDEETESQGGMTNASNQSVWHHTWVDPVLHVLCTGNKLQTTHVIEYILPKLLKCSPDSLAYMTTRLTDTSDRGDKLGALVTCLKRAKMMGILKTATSSDSVVDDCTEVRREMWNDVVPVRVVREALCHWNEQVRLDAFGLLCENLKTTEVLSQTDMTLVKFFLPLNMSSQTPSFRQHLIAFLKKLYIRLRDGRQLLVKRALAMDDVAKTHLDRYKIFFSWLVTCAFNHLHIGAAFPSRTTALSALVMLVNVMAAKQSQTNNEFTLSGEMSPERIQTLLECLNDPFEQNKLDAFILLSSLPHQDITLQDPARMTEHFDVALELASSTRPQDCTTAAFLLRVLLTQPTLLQVATSHLQQRTNPTDHTFKGDSQHLDEFVTEKCSLNDMSGRPADAGCEEHCHLVGSEVAERHLVVLKVLFSQLEKQLEVAKKSLIHAAATAPLYPTMQGIRYILAHVDLRKHRRDDRWRHLVRDLLTISIEVAEVVSPVVSNSSPEGNVPLGPGLALDAVVQSEEDHALLQDATQSAKTVNLMPEYLVVCCWRSIKECSLLLGELTTTAPLIDTNRDRNDGLLSITQIRSLGVYFTTQLLESRHRGAFELAYAGFVKMTDVLWRCPLPEVQMLPKQWLAEILDDIKSHDPSNRLCSTRRSAGVPFYVQALVSTEPTSTGRVCFKYLMTELLKLAIPDTLQSSREDTAQVHSLNVLRALYRDTRLGEDVFPFIADGVRASILGYASQLWAIRNSATLLFGALMTRIFGVKRSKDEMSRKNCLTGRVFFNRFPSLYQFLLDQIEVATSSIGCGGRYQLHPGLYPVLMVLARLYPSVIEGPDTTLNTAAFIPHVIRCASSPVHKTRIMAARAIRPLVAKDHIKPILHSLLGCLPKLPSEATEQNRMHGVLLQVLEIIGGMDDLPGPVLQGVYDIVMPALSDSSWLLSHLNPCLITRKVYAELVYTAFSVFSSPAIANNQDIFDLHCKIVSISHTELLKTTTNPSTPGLAEYHQTLATKLLASFRHQTAALVQPDGVAADDLPIDVAAVVLDLLRSAMYEVRVEVLDFLQTTLTGKTSGENREEEAVNNGVDEKTVRKLRDMLSTGAIFSQLVDMLLGETHPESLTKVVEVLCAHPLSGQSVWRNTHGVTLTLLEIMEKLSQYKSASQDRLRCAAQALSGRLIPQLYADAAKGGTREAASLQAWCVELEERCATEESVLSHLTTATSLLDNASVLLFDPDNVLRGTVFGLWTILVRLLQDEDSTVRDRAADVVCHVGRGVRGHRRANKCHGEGAMTGVVQPTLALSLAISHMVALYAERNWRGVLEVLLSWILTDLEPDWPEEEKQVRLFDKGEMNTYRDEVNFIKVVSEEFVHFLKATIQQTTPLSNHHGNQDAQTNNTGFNSDTYTRPNATEVIRSARLVVLTGKVQQIADELQAKLTYIHSVGCSTPFLCTSMYQDNIISLTRLLLALRCLRCTHRAGIVSEISYDDVWQGFASNRAIPNALLCSVIKPLTSVSF